MPGTGRGKPGHPRERRLQETSAASRKKSTSVPEAPLSIKTLAAALSAVLLAVGGITGSVYWLMSRESSGSAPAGKAAAVQQAMKLDQLPGREDRVPGVQAETSSLMMRLRAEPSFLSSEVTIDVLASAEVPSGYDDPPDDASFDIVRLYTMTRGGALEEAAELARTLLESSSNMAVQQELALYLRLAGRMVREARQDLVLQVFPVELLADRPSLYPLYVYLLHAGVEAGLEEGFAGPEEVPPWWLMARVRTAWERGDEEAASQYFDRLFRQTLAAARTRDVQAAFRLASGMSRMESASGQVADFLLAGGVDQVQPGHLEACTAFLLAAGRTQAAGVCAARMAEQSPQADPAWACLERYIGILCGTISEEDLLKASAVLVQGARDPDFMAVASLALLRLGRTEEAAAAAEEIARRSGGRLPPWTAAVLIHVLNQAGMGGRAEALADLDTSLLLPEEKALLPGGAEAGDSQRL